MPSRSLRNYLVLWLVFLGTFNSFFAAGDRSYLNSELDKSGYTGEYLDLVAGVSQVSVGNVMTAFLQDLKLDPTQYFLQRVDREFIYTPYDEVIDELGFDPLLIPNGTFCRDSENLTIADKEKYWYGFSATYGIPDVPESHLICPILFNTEGTAVTYNMYMKQFTAYEIEYDRDEDTCVMIRVDQDEWIAQDPDKHTAFRWEMEVDLNLLDKDLDSAWNDLPQETKDLIKNVGIGLFSIEQLVLNLNTAQLINKDKIEFPGVEPNSLFWSFMVNDFAGRYIDAMKKEGDGIMFGYTVGIIDPPEHEPTVIPTDLTFHVSPHLEDNGDYSKNYDLYTLNYHMAADENKLPTPKVFSWNWIDVGEREKYDGTMAIRRGLLASRLNRALREEMTEKVCYETVVRTVECGDRIGPPDDPLIFVYFTRFIRPCSTLQSYTIVEDTSDGLVMSWSRNQVAEDHCETKEGLWWTTKIETYGSSVIYFKVTTIEIESEIKIHYYETCSKGAPGTNGYIAWYKSKSTYEIEVSSDGVMSSVLTDFHVENKTEDVEGVSDGCDMSKFNENLRRLLAQVSDLGDMLIEYAEYISTVVSGPSILVFPGAETFTYSDGRFSYYGDLVSRIRYNPNYTRTDCVNPGPDDTNDGTIG